MREAYKDGLAEVYEILKYVDEDSLNDISEDFKEFIKENKSDYKSKIDPEKSLKNQNLLYETKVILSVIYRDFWASPEERKKLIEYDKLQLLKKEMEKEEKYKYENIFQNRENKNEVKKEDKDIEDKEIIIKEKFLNKILNKIKKFFRLGVK